jgi:hypothetical protein
MASDSKFAPTVAARGAKLFCMDAELQHLTPAQLNALHIFKHEVLASAHRLFASIPEDIADPLLESFFKKLVKDPAP